MEAEDDEVALLTSWVRVAFLSSVCNIWELFLRQFVIQISKDNNSGAQIQTMCYI